jgi:hypothetical protein
MSNNITSQSATDELRLIYTIDKFKVPDSARKEFNLQKRELLRYLLKEVKEEGQKEKGVRQAKKSD